ncbi:MAG: response regulator transcription factor [Micrococcales bacterium]|nr:response regulator transcription factor [Micrococcales bacterium]MCL2667822.1 response regulator transcription factor [Micrococcales bacterium]
MPEDVQWLLLVDDEVAITSMLTTIFERAGFKVVVAEDGAAGLAAYYAHHPDVVVCDVMMPVMDGREMVRRLRKAGEWTPVVLLTQHGESADRAVAIDEGADDYVNKPCDPQELLSRVRAVLRRQMAGGQPLASASVLVAGSLRMDRVTRQVVLGGNELVLTPRAAALLDFLMAHPGEVYSRERLLSALWGYAVPASDRAVDQRVSELRRVMGEDEAAQYIETVPGVGYRFCAKVVRG